MASPEVLDFAELLAPIPGENPAGTDLRKDFSPTSAYRVVRDARAKAREAERKNVYEDEDEPTVAQADWKPVLQLGPKLIAEQSKDLEIAALLTEALVREHGFAGLRDGFRLARELVERFWDNLYPLPDEDGVKTRVSPLTGLNGEDGDGLLVGPISRVQITEGESAGPFTLSDYRQAVELDRVKDPDKLARRLEQSGVVSKRTFDTAVSQTSPEFFRNLLEDIEQCSQEFEKLCEVLDEKCGKDESGYPLAPPSSNISNALQASRAEAGHICRHLLASQTEEELSQDEGGGAIVPAGAVPGGSLRHVRTREEAFQALLRVAEFFKRTEPHSPVSYALGQVVRWGRMSLPELLTELIPDQGSREQLFKLTGMQETENRDED